MNFRNTILILTAIFVAVLSGTSNGFTSMERYEAGPIEDTTLVDDPIYARISFAESCLKVTRNEITKYFSETQRLHPGDHIETCSKHFAVIDFYPAGSMTLFPASKLVISPDGTYITLKSAEILFENESGESSFPEAVKCFEESLYHDRGNFPVSFGIHCRGESGMILTAKSGNLWWSCRGTPCEVPQGSGLMGRVTTANYAGLIPPAKPVMTTAYVVPDRFPDDLDTSMETKPVPTDGYSASIVWNPVPMTDQYLVHIFRETDEKRIHHFVLMHHRNHISIRLPGPGRYLARVMAFDFYGVSGDWSEPIAFIADPRNDDHPPVFEAEPDPPEKPVTPEQNNQSGAHFMINK
jgi:hypothetical protein